MFPVKEGVSQLMGHCGYTLGIRTICVDADVLTVQNDCVVTEQVVAIPDVFELYGSPGNDFFRIAGLVAANYSIGHINSALKKWTQSKLSEAVDIDRAEISKYESGQNGEMGFKMLKRFAKALDVSTEQLLDEEDEPPEKNEQHIEKYERLNSENQKMIDKMMDALFLQQSMAS